ncbi:MAG: hypothetical protein CFE24_08580 [Flavobacterium sp. BFFFF2]|nr:MAG: hypothetical protein CFE24_08580 [Flavobacterium sp. BFFFF2]
MVFSPHVSAFYYSVALLCSAKKLKSGTKILIFRCNQKSLNHFIYKKRETDSLQQELNQLLVDEHFLEGEGCFIQHHSPIAYKAHCRGDPCGRPSSAHKSPT